MLSALATAIATRARNPLRRAIAARNPLRQAARAAILLALAAAVALAGAILPAPRTADAHSISVTDIEITSTPGPDGYYATGDRITFDVTFDTTIVTWSSPWNQFTMGQFSTSTRIGFLIGSTNREAYAVDLAGSRNTTAVISFRYDVAATDHDADGISVPTAATLSGNVTHANPGGGGDHSGSPGYALPDTLDSAQSTHLVNTADYDTDDDDLIEITTIAQLNAIRHDLNGDGSPSTGNETAYKTAFHGSHADMGCDTTCTGYELDASLDFAGSAVTNWVPVGAWSGTPTTTAYNGDFDGQGHTISNLRIDSSDIQRVGLFGATNNSTIENVGLLNVDIDAAYTSAHTSVGTVSSLVGLAAGTGTGTVIRSSYATGDITVTVAATTESLMAAWTGGLVGEVSQGSSAVVASYADVAVTVSSAATTTSREDVVGGLVGVLQNPTSIIASYATGNVRGSRTGASGGCKVGGLVGESEGAAPVITASYSIGTAACNPASGGVDRDGGLIGDAASGTSITASYWDTSTSGTTSAFGAGSPTGATGQSTSDLQTPTEYGDSTATPTPIYSAWNVNVDGDTTTGTPTIGGDDPWDFGNATDYPILKFGHNDFSQDWQRPTDHTGDNNLIDVSTPAQLDAIRYDLNGNGDAATNPAHRAAYLAAFPGLTRCLTTCAGYELTANLDLSAPEYTAGAGFTPIGMNADGGADAYTVTFDGNDHTISNLTINLTTTTNLGGSQVGLFARTSGAIRNVGLVNPSVSNTRSSPNAMQDYDDRLGYTGALVGFAVTGAISGSWVDGGAVAMTQSANENYNHAGCLVGYTDRPGGVTPPAHISNSWASCAASASADPGAGGGARAGGLVGGIEGNLTNSYATGTVSVSGPASGNAGGLVGSTSGGSSGNDITSSYATGAVSNTATGNFSRTGGLAGSTSDTNIYASFATGNVEATAAASVGGLVGYARLSANKVIHAAYATGTVSRTSASGGGNVGGLAGEISSASGASVTATYATGAVSNMDSAGNQGGLVGNNASATNFNPVNNSYWNNEASGTNQMNSAACGATNCSGQTGSALQTPTNADGYAGIYANWNLNLDGVAGNDDPWDFGTATEYPVLKYGFDLRVIRLQRGAVGNTDYDANDNNLIDIGRAGVDGLHQLNAVRWDLDGSGEDGITGDLALQYLAAFPDLIEGMGCPDGCQGYELLTDLDFDDDGSGTVDSDDAYENWTPIGNAQDPLIGGYAGDFQGNGHAISNLTIDASNLRFVGLFAKMTGGEYGGIGLVDVDITSTYTSTSARWAATGALVGRIRNAGLTNSYSTGSVTYNGSGNTYDLTGGLIGETVDLDPANRYTFASLWSSADVTVNSSGTWWHTAAGGLIGLLFQETDLVASYATGDVTSTDTSHTTHVAGLVGYTNQFGNTITACYATGAVSSLNTSATVRPLRSGAPTPATLTDSYWDTTGMGAFLDSMGDPPAASEYGVGKTIFELQTPTNADGYAGIYANWNVDIDNADGDNNPATGVDDPWDFGTDREYPALKTGYLGAPDLLTLQRPIDYDRDNNGLLEITTPAQLRAVNWDIDGNAARDSGVSAENWATYGPAFPRPVNSSLGCPAAGCSGYELDADLDLSGYPNWSPLRAFSATFDGQGHVIRNLTITDASSAAVGLWAGIQTGAVVESVGLLNVNIAEGYTSNDPDDTGGLNRFNVGALAGYNNGTVRYSYAAGVIQATVTGAETPEHARTNAGGLIGVISAGGTVAASWADVAVSITSPSTNTVPDGAGGLVGRIEGSNGNVSNLIASYAEGNVSADRATSNVGGLVGTISVTGAATNATVTASYSIGTPSSTDASATIGGLVGANAGTINNSYWDETTTGITTGSNGAPHSTSDLQSVTGYTSSSIYVFWNVDIDNADGNNDPASGGDDPWYFGSATAYPILQFGYTAANISRQLGVEPVTDYDTNGNGLIEVSSLAQLNAIRWDLTGEGTPATANTAAYLSSFPGPLPAMGCRGGRCDGYELTADLDFDTGTAGDRTDDEYYNSGAGWTPIAAQSNLVGYTGQFVGNGHTIANLYINHTVGSRSYHGLFGNIGAGTGAAAMAGEVSGVGLPNASVTAYGSSVLMGTLAGRARSGSTVTASWATGSITSTSSAGTGTKVVGGLVGHMGDSSTAVRGSWAAVTVTADAAAGRVVAGGLVGRINDSGAVLASYATGAVSGGQGSDTNNGGLIGSMAAASTLRASYAIGKVSAGASGLTGGLIGNNSGTVHDSYWDNQIWTDTSAAGEGKTTTELQTPTDYGDSSAMPPDIYGNWNVDIDNADGDNDTATGEDNPWDFGTDREYPVLKYRHLGAPALLTLQRPIDYDRDGDNLIEITTPAQLNVVRWDTDGDGANIGAAGRTDYAAAFPNPMADMGCAMTCAGYELEADLDLSGVPNWTPINELDSTTTVTFQGNGHTIRNLRITAATSASVGLFTSIGENAVVESVGLVDVNIADTSTLTSSVFTMGALAGSSEGTIRYSYATGAVSATLAGGATGQAITRAGGLVGYVNGGAIAASWAEVAVSVASDSANTAADAAGGIVGGLGGSASLTAAYAKGDVSASRANSEIGGLVGAVGAGATVDASYSIGTPSSADAGATIGGLVGANAGTSNITASYFDRETTGLPAGTHGRTTMALQEPQEYGTQSTDIYMNWNVNVDGEAGNDDPWYFGGADDYPILQFGYNAANISRQMGVAPVNDYDRNGNGLIDIANLAALNAIRYDLDGDGDPSDIAAYLSGFPGPVTGMGCPPVKGCTGYELVADLDFDTNGDGMVDGDDPNSYADWEPIGTGANDFNTEFFGNGHIISNLTINHSGSNTQAGLFGSASGSNAVVHSLGLINPSVTVTAGTAVWVGALAGVVEDGGQVYDSYVIGGTVTSAGTANSIGGLIGRMDDAGTLVIATYASGVSVTATAGTGHNVGGLVGQVSDNSALTASYAVSDTVSGTGNIGGVVGSSPSLFPGTINNSYWDSDVFSGSSSHGAGQSKDDLQGTDDYSGIFSTWNTHDLDGDGNLDAPWDFLADHQYPILRLSHIATQTAPQDTTLRSIVKPANVDEVVGPVGNSFTLEIQPTVVSVELPESAFITAQPGAQVVITGAGPTATPYVAGPTIPLTPAGADIPTQVTVLVTSANGYSEQEWTLTILRIFCPKAEITGPANMVGEGGSADFTVLVCGTTTEPVIVSWAVDTEASTADAGDLGRALTGTITVPTGDDREATLSFPITDDAEAEPSETIVVQITGVSGGTERIDTRPATATIALSDPSLNLRAPEGTGTGGAGDSSDAPLTASSMLVLTEGAGRSYSLRLAGNPQESVTIVIHSNHEGVTTTPDRVTFDRTNWQSPQRVTVNAAPDGDDNHDRATLTHILTDEDGGLLEIIDRIPLFVTDTDPPDDDDIC